MSYVDFRSSPAGSLGAIHQANGVAFEPPPLEVKAFDIGGKPVNALELLHGRGLSIAFDNLTPSVDVALLEGRASEEQRASIGTHLSAQRACCGGHFREAIERQLGRAIQIVTRSRPAERGKLQ